MVQFSVMNKHDTTYFVALIVALHPLLLYFILFLSIFFLIFYFSRDPQWSGQFVIVFVVVKEMDFLTGLELPAPDSW